MAGHGVELQRVIPNVMNGNVRIVALVRHLSVLNTLILCRPQIHSLHLKSPPFNFKPLKLEKVGFKYTMY